LRLKLDINKDINAYKDKINAVSPSFCLAKWKQVTLHLQLGQTHSCHHPVAHRIPLEEIKIDASALHNTKFKKEQRKQMLEGTRPAECDYCWNVEDSSPDAVSDRIYKSYDVWAQPYFDQVKNMPWDQNVNPSYLEVSFSNVCNFKCSYCSPQISSMWMEEIEKYGPYPTGRSYNDIEWMKRDGVMPIPHNQHNPYVEAFWNWWPSVYPDLKHFRITGGEPLLSKDTFKALDYVIDNPNPEIHFSVNSNLCVPTKIFDKFIEKIKIICGEKKVQKFKIFTSCDTHGAQAEYIRDGLNYELWLANIHRILTEVPGCTITIMSTYNALSIFRYTDFLKDMLAIKNQYGGHGKTHAPLIIDVPYLRHPGHQAIFIMPNKYAELIYDQVTFMYENLEHPEWYGTSNRGFFKWEADKFKRIYELMIYKEEHKKVTAYHKDFVNFVDEHDRRRGTNFLKTFPEMEELYRHWKYG
jgi:organic radical activating enzyme